MAGTLNVWPQLLHVGSWATVRCRIRINAAGDKRVALRSVKELMSDELKYQVFDKPQYFLDRPNISVMPLNRA